MKGIDIIIQSTVLQDMPKYYKKDGKTFCDINIFYS